MSKSKHPLQPSKLNSPIIKIYRRSFSAASQSVQQAAALFCGGFAFYKKMQLRQTKRKARSFLASGFLVETEGIEPPTSRM